MNNPRYLAIFLGLALATAAPASARGPREKGTQVPIAVQAKIMLNSISYHKSPRFRDPSRLVVAIVYDGSAVPADLPAIKAAFTAGRAGSLGGKSFSVVEVPFSSISDLKKKLEQAGAGVAYIVPGNEAAARKSVSATRAVKLLSMAGDSNYVHWLGVCLGVEEVAGRKKILVNLSGCKLESVSFDPRLLRIATVSF